MLFQEAVIDLLLAVSALVIIITIAKSIYHLYSKIKLKEFLKKIQRDPLGKIIVEEIISRGIKFGPFGLFDDFFLRKKILMMAVTSPTEKEILVSGRYIKKYIKGEHGLKEEMLIGLAHEWGHIREKILISEMLEREHEVLSGRRRKEITTHAVREKSRNGCDLPAISCLYGEVTATKYGIELIEKKSEKSIGEIFSEEILVAETMAIFSLCMDCVDNLENPKNGFTCPRLKDLNAMGVCVEDNKVSIKLF